MSSILQDIPASDLATVLRELKQYRKMVKVAWKKAESLRTQSEIYRVEYAPELTLEYAQKLALDYLPRESIIEYMEQPKISAGIRIFQGDTLIDSSYETLIKSFVI
jgi:F0F1-type ATP synthase delta subunit